jgi:hypothetical protein
VPECLTRARGAYTADGGKHRMLTETLKVKEIVTEIGYHVSRFPDADDVGQA